MLEERPVKRQLVRKDLNMLEKQIKRYRRHRRVRSRIKGTAEVPRLCVFKSSKHIYAQIIDDDQGKTIVSADDTKVKKTGIEAAKKIGKLVAEKAIEKKIVKIVFDRGGYKYHGRVKALADAARAAGLKF